MTQPARKGSRREMLKVTAYPHTVHVHLLHWKLKHEANNGYREATLYRQCSHLQMQVLEQSSTAMRFTAYNHITTRGYFTELSFILLLAPLYAINHTLWNFARLWKLPGQHRRPIGDGLLGHCLGGFKTRRRPSIGL